MDFASTNSFRADRTTLINAGHTIVYAYDAADQLISTTDNGAVTNYSYDSNGNLNVITPPAGAKTTYTWDAMDRLKNVDKPGLTSKVTHTYAHDNLLHGKQGPNGSEGFLRDAVRRGEVVFWNRASAGTMGPAQLMAVGATLGRSLGQQSAGTGLDRQFHLNEHGDVLATSDSTQTTETTYQNDAFGKVLAGSATNNPYDYAADSGYWHDPDSGLVYIQQRWYDPNLGLWLSDDPVDGEPRYDYCYNQPTKLIDSNGAAPDHVQDRRRKQNTESNRPRQLKSKEYRILSRPQADLQLRSQMELHLEANGRHAQGGSAPPAGPPGSPWARPGFSSAGLDRPEYMRVGPLLHADLGGGELRTSIPGKLSRSTTDEELSQRLTRMRGFAGFLMRQGWGMAQFLKATSPQVGSGTVPLGFMVASALPGIGGAVGGKVGSTFGQAALGARIGEYAAIQGMAAPVAYQEISHGIRAGDPVAVAGGVIIALLPVFSELKAGSLRPDEQRVIERNAGLKDGTLLDPAQQRSIARQIEHISGGPIHSPEKLETLRKEILNAVEAEVRGEKPPAIVTYGPKYHKLVITPFGRVWQLKDIDWDFVRSDGLTNRQAANIKLAPQRANPKGEIEELTWADYRWEGVQLHHTGKAPLQYQGGEGTLVEVWANTHIKYHKAFGSPQESFRRNEQAASAQVKSSEYWKWRVRHSGE